MTASNAIIYHCIVCGRIVHAESEAEPPQCCGNAMTKACEEITPTSKISGEPADGHEETPPDSNNPQKPR
jgi:hypothetical protein